MLSKEERDRIERLLQEERRSAVEALGEFDAARGVSFQEESGELSVYRFHMADIGTEAMEREKSFLLASQEGERLYGVDEALRRLYADPETFGTCARCGAPIGMERLSVVPTTTHCADCQREVEG
jgi:DnaK suppressor protein